MDGEGLFMWADGRKYNGQYKEDKKHGYGVFEWPDGRKYKGEWDNGKQHGKGVFVNADNTEKEGIWNDGKRVKWTDEWESIEMEIYNNYFFKINL